MFGDVLTARKWSLDNIVNDILTGNIKNIIVMTGAGVSVNAGIPDFRSPHSGLFSKLKEAGFNRPEDIFDLKLFRKKPELFYSVVETLICPIAKPTKAHLFIRLLQDKGLLLRCYTQNIDPLDTMAGITPDRLINAHGSFATMGCIECNCEYPISILRESIAVYKADKKKWKPPRCTEIKECALFQKRNCDGLLKPAITFYGEPLPSRFGRSMLHDIPINDLLIVMGTSLKVYPFNTLVSLAKKNIPRILINKEAVGLTHTSHRASLDSGSPISFKQDIPKPTAPSIPAAISGSDSSDDNGDHLSGGFRFFESKNKRDLLLCGDADEKVDLICKKLGWTGDLELLMQQYDKTEKSFWDLLEDDDSMKKAETDTKKTVQ